MAAISASQVKELREPDSITLEDVLAARTRIEGAVLRSPLIRLEGAGAGDLYLKLENLQPIRSFKLRGADNAMALLSPDELAAGVYTASAGNMAQGLAWAARRRGTRCTVVCPDGAPQTKLDGIRRLSHDLHPATRRHRLLRLPDQMHLRVGKLDEHLIRPGQVELRETREEQQADARRHRPSG